MGRKAVSHDSEAHGVQECVQVEEDQGGCDRERGRAAYHREDEPWVMVTVCL